MSGVFRNIEPHPPHRPANWHKVLTYIKQRAVSGVFRTIDPTPPFHPASVSSPASKAGGTHSPGGEGGGVNSSEDARHCSLLYICKYFVPIRLAY
jgi:hypothetical protein